MLHVLNVHVHVYVQCTCTYMYVCTVCGLYVDYSISLFSHLLDARLCYILSNLFTNLYMCIYVYTYIIYIHNTYICIHNYVLCVC